MQDSQKKVLSFVQIWNMSFGFLGIQFAFALQGGYVSRIFQTLGASKDSLPQLWLLAPLAGLFVQPIIGYLSDRTWNPRWGRRKPFFFIGAVFASIALIFMPHSPALWMAVGMLFILDASVNVSMEPFRALVADLLPKSQRSYGFVVQTLIIGIGTWVASQLPWFLNKMGVSNQAAEHVVPQNVKLAFLIGGIVFMLAILYTILTTKEYPPEDLDNFEAEKKATAGVGRGVTEILSNIKNMPSTMVKLGVIQFFSWFAFFTMWSMAVPALTEHVFNAPIPDAELIKGDSYIAADLAYNNAADLVGSSMGMYGLSSMVFALVLTLVSRNYNINRKLVHMGALIIGGLGFFMMQFCESVSMLNWCFISIGFSWGSILSMPYAMLSSTIDPKKMGVFMGLFNMFIVIPQIVAGVGGINFAYKTFLGDAIINTMILAGISLLIAGLCNLLITEPEAIRYEGE